MEVAMKKYIAVAIALALMLSVTGSVLAGSLGISPSSIKMDVPATDSTTVDFNVHYFSGDVEVNLEDIPLRVEPRQYL
jgi:hypothetical protein